MNTDILLTEWKLNFAFCFQNLPNWQQAALDHAASPLGERGLWALLLRELQQERLRSTGFIFPCALRRGAFSPHCRGGGGGGMHSDFSTSDLKEEVLQVRKFQVKTSETAPGSKLISQACLYCHQKRWREKERKQAELQPSPTSPPLPFTTCTFACYLKAIWLESQGMPGTDGEEKPRHTADTVLLSGGS